MHINMVMEKKLRAWIKKKLCNQKIWTYEHFTPINNKVVKRDSSKVDFFKKWNCNDIEASNTASFVDIKKTYITGDESKIIEEDCSASTTS